MIEIRDGHIRDIRGGAHFENCTSVIMRVKMNDSWVRRREFDKKEKKGRGKRQKRAQTL
jgi:hypothetical protein